MKFLIVRNRKTSGARRLQRKLQSMGHKCKVQEFANKADIPYIAGATRRTLIQWGGNQIDKLRFLTLASDAMVSTPEFWESKDHAQEWLDEKPKRRIMVRHILNGSGGAGCEVVTSGNKLPDAPLYVEYIPKDAEYRVHWFKGLLAPYIQQKKKRRDHDVNHLIRNLSNGWVYCTNDVAPPEDVITQSLAAFNATNLEFGAVDVIWNRRREKAYVLEINTAPGLEGKTVDVYAEYFTRER